VRNRANNLNLPKNLSALTPSKPSETHARVAARTSLPGCLTALSIEFVAKPEEAHLLPVNLPAAIAGAFREVTGYAGCCVLVSDKEARLVTVITFWSGEERTVRCGENVRWVYALLEPYLDHCLRAGTFDAQLPIGSMMGSDFSASLQFRGPAEDAERAEFLQVV
jgi:hypothetical protein